MINENQDIASTRHSDIPHLKALHRRDILSNSKQGKCMKNFPGFHHYYIRALAINQCKMIFFSFIKSGYAIHNASRCSRHNVITSTRYVIKHDITEMDADDSQISLLLRMASLSFEILIVIDHYSPKREMSFSRCRRGYCVFMFINHIIMKDIFTFVHKFNLKEPSPFD
jgi:hypothetical protein